MASIAVLPILIGLAVDYAIQFQSRIAEARRAGGGRGRRGPGGRSRGRNAATIAIAALATGTGFLVLLLSPVPMVRGFGLLLVVGIAVALACALTAGPAAIVLFDRKEARLAPRGAAPARSSAQARGPAAARRCWPRREWRRHRSARGTAAARIEVPRRPAPDPEVPGRLLGAVSAPGRVLAIALRWRRSAGSRTPRLRSSRTSPSSCRRACRRCATSHARAGDRSIRGDRRHRPRGERGDAADGRLDDRLRAGAARALRLSREQGLRARDPVPGAVAPRPVLGRHRDRQRAAAR